MYEWYKHIHSFIWSYPLYLLLESLYWIAQGNYFKGLCNTLSFADSAGNKRMMLTPKIMAGLCESFTKNKIKAECLSVCLPVCVSFVGLRAVGTRLGVQVLPVYYSGLKSSRSSSRMQGGSMTEVDKRGPGLDYERV